VTTAIATIADAKNTIGLDPTSTDKDVILQALIDSMSDVVEYIVGPVRDVTYTEWHKGSVDEIVLRRRPVESVTSVTEVVGVVSYPLTQQDPITGPLDAFGFFLMPEEGIIQRTAYGIPSWFAALPWATQATPGWMAGGSLRFGTGPGRVQVVYVAGRTTIPAHIKNGLLELVKVHYQQTQQNGRASSRAQQNAEDMGLIVLGYLVPNRVREMLLPSTQARGIR
jgi:hypothetical protein